MMIDESANVVFIVNIATLGFSLKVNKYDSLKKNCNNVYKPRLVSLFITCNVDSVVIKVNLIINILNGINIYQLIDIYQKSQSCLE